MPSNMDLAAKIAEKIKSSELGEWIDENDMREIGKEAIKIAFLKPRSDGSGYSSRDKPPLLAEIMADTFKEEVQKKMLPVIEELMNDESFTQMMAGMLVFQLPAMMREATADLANMSIFRATEQLDDSLKSKISDTLSRASMGSSYVDKS